MYHCSFRIGIVEEMDDEARKRSFLSETPGIHSLVFLG
jgi:hypothetical protein